MAFIQLEYSIFLAANKYFLFFGNIILPKVLPGINLRYILYQ